jgi:hypothetical protein
MSRPFVVRQYHQLLAGLTTGVHPNERRLRARRLPWMEPLEDRALLATTTVHVINSSFSPDPITIHMGDTVHWVWDTDHHSTTSVAGSAEQWDSGVHNI